ncbi:flagellar protein export ATPase FliI [Heliorestis convoluta]|uniref:Type 3 secretion system ATPase n=1 Tax=Heliorestis convoluta TaxID=356322 RepID=A0A5Q2N7C0_9FIRM|nr:flagellar protein export ATPase FliI [Heliorestis convoluta]QGG48170.1 Flagellar protein export ATPase FliI [Heliorestis convoluta]
MKKYMAAIQKADFVRLNGKVSQVIGLVVQSDGPSAHLGELCYLSTQQGKERIGAEVVGFRDKKTLLMPLGDITGIGPGAQVLASGDFLKVPVGKGLLGRVLDGLGNFIDGKGLVNFTEAYPLDAAPPHPLRRQRIQQILPFGVKAIDGFLTCGKGQRLGIFAGSGVGKSTLLGMIARNAKADINVIALIGERGREVREFLEKDLGPEGLARSVVVVATSDQPALVRLKGALVATAIAEYFRDQGKDVMLMMDSVTRFAMAQREVGLAVGEPPATRGYTPSVFALLPKLLERSGTSAHGTITGLYTVLVDGDDMNEPIADTVRGILDGHVVLSRDLAAQNHYPAIDVLRSVSRVMIELVEPEHRQLAARLRQVLATYNEAKDLLDIGAYQAGANPKIDYALQKIDECNDILKQQIEESIPLEETLQRLRELFV